MRDVRTGLVWRAAVFTGVTWGDAYQQCRDLGPGWRLPSLTELQTLIDETQAGVGVDRGAFPDRPGDFYWTSSFFYDTPSMIWFVSIGYGNSHWLAASDSHSARCVR